VHSRDGEFPLVELLSEPVDLAAGRAEDDGLSDGDGLVEVAQGVELPLLLLDGNVCTESASGTRLRIGCSQN